ncbi:MAG: GDSL-type esterase/lipase family protein [Planctomycetaceae bacterium]
MNLRSVRTVFIFCSCLVVGHAVAAEDKAVTIGLIGDSTVATTYGWGPAFADRFNESVTVLNYAVNGATLESLSVKLNRLIEQKPDYILIQFGHNDMKRYGAEEYRKKLTDYVQRVKHGGSQAVILSSVTRRVFDENGQITPVIIGGDRSLPAFAQAAKAVAQENDVPFIDLNSISIAHHNKIGPEASAAYNFEGSDRTHFSNAGAAATAELILAELKSAVPDLSALVK